MMNHKYPKKKRMLTEVFLGKRIRVIRSSDILKQGVEGFVENETKNMFIIITEKGVTKIPKKESVFEIELNGVYEQINGKDICYNLHDRIKKYA